METAETAVADKSAIDAMRVRLDRLFTTPEFAGLPLVEQESLMAQAEAAGTLSYIIGQRIARGAK